MKFYNVVCSTEAPNVRDCLWLKPVEGGFTLYWLEGYWKPLKMVDDGNTSSVIDDTVQDLIGSVQDEKTANTINGAKAYAKDQADTLMGTAEDEATDMTLYGLKAYIDAQVAG